MGSCNKTGVFESVFFAINQIDNNKSDINPEYNNNIKMKIECTVFFWDMYMLNSRYLIKF